MRRSLKDKIFSCIDQEEELPGEIPDNIYEKIEKAVLRGDKNFVAEVFRMAVRATKKGIKDRIIS